MDPNVRRRSVVLQTATEEQHHQQQRKRHKVRKQGSSPVIFIWILASCAALTVITYFWISTSTENTTTWATKHVHQIQTPNKRAALQESIHPAREIPGIELEIDGIQVVHPTLSYPARWVYPGGQTTCMHMENNCSRLDVLIYLFLSMLGGLYFFFTHAPIQHSPSFQ